MEGELGDVAFVIDRIDDELPDLADTDHLAVAGHSSGAIVAYGVAFNTCCHIEGIDAVLTEALLPIPLDGEYADDLKGTPVMFMNGEADPMPPEAVSGPYDDSDSPKYHLTIAGGDHSAVYRDGPGAPLVAEAALAFFDLHVKGRASAIETVESLPGLEADR
jgi:hypothetical protein